MDWCLRSFQISSYQLAIELILKGVSKESRLNQKKEFINNLQLTHLGYFFPFFFTKKLIYLENSCKIMIYII
jgi:hypothetical protein